MSHRGPTFIAAGFSRCGTTSLYAYLRAHPDVWMPPLKEIVYWDLERVQGRRAPKRRDRLRFAAAHTIRGPGWSRRLDDSRFLVRYALGRPGDEWYLKLFDPARGRAAGDLSPSYMRLAEPQVRELRAALPDTRILFMLRDPFERAWSNARKSLARGQGRRMEDVPDAEVQALLTDTWFLDQCDYATPLRRWRAIYPDDQVMIGYTADLDEHPEVMLSELARFIGVDPAPLVDAATRLDRQFTTGEHGGDLTPRWERVLAEQLLPMLTDLADDLGGPATAWRDRARHALERPPAER